MFLRCLASYVVVGSYHWEACIHMISSVSEEGHLQLFCERIGTEPIQGAVPTQGNSRYNFCCFLFNGWCLDVASAAGFVSQFAATAGASVNLTILSLVLRSVNLVIFVTYESEKSRVSRGISLPTTF